MFPRAGESSSESAIEVRACEKAALAHGCDKHGGGPKGPHGAGEGDNFVTGSRAYFLTRRKSAFRSGSDCLKRHLESLDEGASMRLLLRMNGGGPDGGGPSDSARRFGGRGTRQPQGQPSRSEPIEYRDEPPSESLIVKSRTTLSIFRSAGTIGQRASVCLPPVGPQDFCRPDLKYLRGNDASQYNYSSSTCCGTFLRAGLSDSDLRRGGTGWASRRWRHWDLGLRRRKAEQPGTLSVSVRICSAECAQQQDSSTVPEPDT